MDQIPFEQLGTAGMTLVALVWIVRAFLANNKEIAGDFKNTIDNHIHSDTEMKQKLADAVDDNTKAIEKLMEKI